MEELIEQKKYKHLAVQFSLNILAVLVLTFAIQIFLTVRVAKKGSQGDYSDFSEKVIAEDAGKIQYWNEVLVNDLRIYSDNDVTKAGNKNEIISWLLSHENIRNPLFNYVMFCSPDGVGYASDGKILTVISKPFFRSIMSITYLLTKQCQLLHLFFVVPLYLIFIIGLRLIKYEEKILNAKLIFLAIDSFINILSLTYLCSFDSDCGKAYDENMKCKNNCIDIYLEKRKEEKSKEIPQKIEALKNENKLLKEANDKILKELTELNDEYENSVLSNVENKKIEVILWYVKKKYNKSYPPDIIYQILTKEMKEKFKININNSSKIKEIFLFYIKEKFIECLTCPLTADIFLNPVTTPEGQTFDKNYLLKELEKTGKNPLARSPLNENHLVENKLVRDL